MNNRLAPNAIKDADAWVNPDPRRIDVAVNYLQPLLQALPWNNLAYSRAIKFSRNQDGKEYIYPALFVGQGVDYLDAMQLDSVEAYTFFYADDAESSTDFSTGICTNQWEQLLKLYVWMDMEKVNINNGFDVAPQVKDSILSIFTGFKSPFRSSTQWIQNMNVVSIYEDPFKVFEGFSTQQTNQQFLYYPYRALRFDIDITFLDGCFC